MDAILINGTVGSGKSTLVDTLSDLIEAPHAAIDLDWIRRLNRSSPEDRFNHRLTVTNLRDLAKNYRAAGAARFVLGGVVENAGTVAEYADALGVDGIFVCRLVVRPELGLARLRERMAFDPVGLAWHLDRHGELAGILDRENLDDLVLDSSELSPLQLAHTVLRAVGWSALPQS